jgi:hypothetical protein
MPKKRPDYFSYLLRVWRDNGEGTGTWRASLEGALTGKRHRFACLEDLLAYLQRQTGAGCDANSDEGATVG